MVREAINKMKNGKAVGPSGVVPEKVKAAGEVGVDMIADLVNQIRGLKYRGLKLTDQILKMRIEFLRR